MRTTQCLGWLAIVVLGLGIGPVGAALVNPSFEDPSAAGGDINLAPTGWTASGGAVWTSADTTNFAPVDGLQYVSLGNGTTLYQFTDIVAQAGTTYTASVYGLCDRAVGGNNVFLTLLAGTGISDYSVVAQTAAHSDTFTWVQLTASFTCTAEDAGKNMAVYLNGGAGSWCWQQYDDVTLTPEPATMGLLAVGGLGVLFRRKR
jgi:hypothetical protein